MSIALRQSIPGLDGPYRFVGVVDAFCKVNDPWDFAESTVNISSPSKYIRSSTPAGVISSGRIWTQGLAYYGWIFYLSKFYEILDTAIILAKGKKSSTLQTYHHAGAILCMWAGIRYMGPPIWIFVLYNSGIHALMACINLLSPTKNEG